MKNLETMILLASMKYVVDLYAYDLCWGGDDYFYNNFDGEC